MKRIDIKSLAYGLCAGVLSMLVIGAAFPSNSNQLGRFQIAGTGAMFMVLDTATGQTWLGDFHTTIQPADPSIFLPKLGQVLQSNE